MGGARPPGFPSKGGPPTVRPAIARLPDDLEQRFVKATFNSPNQGGIGSLAVPTRMKDGGLVDALFSKTDHGKKLSSNQFEVRKGKDGRRMVYKKGTNIFVGTADKVFDEKYDGGLIRSRRPSSRFTTKQSRKH